MIRSEPDLVLSGVTTATGDEFLAWLAGFVVASTPADAVYVGALVGAPGERFVVQTAVGTTEDLSDREFAVEGSIAEKALGENAFSIAVGLVDTLPDDEIVQAAQASGAVALALHGPSPRPLGVVVALTTAPLDDAADALIRGVLEAFRPRLSTVVQSRRSRAELEAVRKASAAETSEETLVALVRALAAAMRVKAAFVSELTDAEHGLAKSLALVVDGEALPSMNYAVAGTPTGTTFDEGVLLQASGICELYSDVNFLRSLNADGYLAVTLRCPHGKPVASLGLIHDAPLDPALCDSTFFKVCVSHARSEVLRLRAQRDRLDLERELLAAQRAESLGLLAGGVAHDFRNILSAIVGNADLATAELPLDSPLHARLDGIRSAAERATLLCAQLLAFAGKGSVSRRVIDVNHLIADMGELLGVSLAGSCELRMDLADDVPAIEADLAQMQQIVMNLLTNAAEASAAPGGSIHVVTGSVDSIPRCAGHEVQGSGARPGAHVFIEVRDEGVGLPPHELPRIFEPFYSTKQSRAGRGLGLAALAGIVRGHDGTISTLR